MKYRLFSVVFALLLCVPARAVSAPPEDSAAACVVMHPQTGRVLCAHDADERLPIASTTKIMTALVVLERCDPGDRVEILPEDTAAEGSSMGLRAGETYTVEQLLYGLMLCSGNDAALALARHTAGSVAGFARLMNDKAAALGLTRTHFCNPHGLDEEGHLSTARDLAALACAAMENESFRTVVSTVRYPCGDQIYVNHNKLLSTLPGAIGVKTGYTQAAGRILVSCAERNGTRFVCVTIDDPQDWDDHAALLDWAFSNWHWRVFDDAAYVLPVLSGQRAKCVVLPGGTPGLLLETNARVRMVAELPRFVFAPLRAGEQVGTLTVTAPDGASASARLVCAQDVPADEAMRLSLSGRLCRGWRLIGRSFFSFDPKF